MKTWKSSLFGDNRLNFYGWIFAGLVIIAGSLFTVLIAIIFHKMLAMLAAIYLVLIGIFCLMLQNYHARVSEKIDAQDEQP
jgi:hypothetical membrane protein